MEDFLKVARSLSPGLWAILIHLGSKHVAAIALSEGLAKTLAYYCARDL